MFKALTEAILEAELTFDVTTRTWTRNDGNPVVAKFNGAGYRCIQVNGHFYRQCVLEVMYVHGYESYGEVPYGAFLGRHLNICYA